MSSFAFCETVTASSTSPIHIRELSSAGRFEGGGADTRALCGIEVAWDISGDPADLRERLYARNCQRCVVEYQSRAA